MTDTKPQVFLSYAHEDIGMAKRVYSDLKGYGLNVWFDADALQAGEQWPDRIQDAIENSRYFLALLSTQSLTKKGFVQKELKTALNVLDLFPDSESYIILVRLCECRISNRRLRDRQWVDLFPEEQYNIGIKKILEVISPESFIIRHEPALLTSNEVNMMLREHGYYDHDRNPSGKGIVHHYKEQPASDGAVVRDDMTGLIWQRAGSEKEVAYEEVDEYIAWLNRTTFAGFSDWRIPTLDEAMCIMEADKRNGELYIDPVFQVAQPRIWTSDSYQGESFSNAWVVYYYGGYCSFLLLNAGYYVRAVCSQQ